MIPETMDSLTKSPGEPEVFRRLRDDPATGDWIALHSVDISHHVRSVMGELDFLVIIPGRGALALEVKGCRTLKRDHGMWYYGKSGQGDPRGPFKQASEAMHSVRRVFEKRQDLSGIPFWSAVVFPFVPFSERSDEWHAWQVIDSTVFHSSPLSALLLDVLDRGRAFLTERRAGWFDPRSADPTPRQCQIMAQALRPDFDIEATPGALRKERQRELETLTEEQFAALDAMSRNPRVVFEGPAGTGKTFLAIEAARRASSEGRRVLFVCYNHLLGEWLHRQTAALAPRVTTTTLHAYMRGITHADATNRDSEWWESALPGMALESLLEDDRFQPFSELIVDEAQDVLREPLLDVLDVSLEGGLAAGTWRMFGDFERQSLYGGASIPLADFVTERGGHPSAFTLTVNCRNAPRVVEFTRLLARLSTEYARVLRRDSGADPRIRFFDTDAEQVSLLAAELEGLYRDGLRGSEIVILSRRATGSCAEHIEEPPWSDRVAPIQEAGPGQIPYASIHGFKGLEAAAVIVTDLDTVVGPEAESLFYVAVTRATDRLILLADANIRPEILGLLSAARPATPALQDS
jgi:hypothetical protein